MLTPFFVFLLFFIIVMVLEGGLNPSETVTDKKEKTYNEKRTESILKVANEKYQKEQKFLNEIKGIETELKPVPPKKLDINTSYYQQTELLDRGL